MENPLSFAPTTKEKRQKSAASHRFYSNQPSMVMPSMAMSNAGAEASSDSWK